VTVEGKLEQMKQTNQLISKLINQFQLQPVSPSVAIMTGITTTSTVSVMSK